MKRRGFHLVVAVLAVCLLASTHAFAQGGGASTTGSINGKVADSSGGVLPGVTVSATSPSSMGVQSSVTDAGGNYRFPALPPGTYTVTFELGGFNTLKRENIQISMGFTATVNVELGVASLNETVTVTGDSPVIDTSNTRVQQNFKLEALQEIPNSRDLWSLLAVTPGVGMGRIDVGGNRAGTQTGYVAYGYAGQNRVLVEGINTTEGTSGAGFYVDYGSFEEVFLGTIGQGAEMPTPGVQSQMLGKSGGNKFQGEFYQDYETNGMISENISKHLPSQFAFDPVTNTGGIRLHSNETQKYRDSNINVGGPIKKDKLWWYFSYRNQKTSVGQPNFIGPISDKLFDTKLWNPSGKTTYQINQNNKLIGYYQWGQKEQPNRLPQAALNYTSLDGTLSQLSGSWIYKGEWNGTINNKTYVEARYGVFGYYFPLLANSDTTQHENFDNFATLLTGADQKEQTDRQRRQATGSVTYFKDGWGGSHNFKLGGEVLMETGWYGSPRWHRATSARRLPAAAPVPGADVCANGIERGQSRRRSERQPVERRQSEHVRLVRHRPVVDWPCDAEPRRPLRPLRCVHPGSDAAGVHVPQRGQHRRAVIPGATLCEVGLVRASPRRHLRSLRHRQDRAQGQLRDVPVQPGRRRGRERQPEPAVEEPHVSVARQQGLRRLHPGRQDLSAG